MNRSAYQSDSHVEAFITWASPLVRGDRSFSHAWCSPRFGMWSCGSVFDAYRRYEWPFSVTLPGDSHPTRGRSLNENVIVLDRMRGMLQESADNHDSDSFLTAAIAVVEWGGVRRNVGRLRDLGRKALPQLSAAAEQLNPKTADTENLFALSDMNSGFSKIYSLLVDGLPIYDSRVACALGFLVQSYCQESGLQHVPEQLALRLPQPRQREPRRDPSLGSLFFHELRWGHVKEYAISNLKTAWVLEPLAQIGEFGGLPGNRRLLALQSALFMIGYTVPGQGSLPP